MAMTQIDKMIQTAVKELGYREKATNAQLYDKYANAGDENWTKYSNDFYETWKTWFNTDKRKQEWCTIFHDWCYVETFGVSESVKMLFNEDPQTCLRAGCMFLPDIYRRHGRWGSTPKVGAQFILRDEHTGIVIAVRDGYFYTIEGNTEDSVKAVKRLVNDGEANGYGFGYPLFNSEQHGVWHMVEASDTLNSIAAKYGVTVSQIVAANGIEDPNLIVVGQVFYISRDTVTDPDPEPDECEYTEYIVKSGDTLGEIAVSHGLKVSEVAEYNWIKDINLIHVGQVLKIPVEGRRDYIKLFQQAINLAKIDSLYEDGIWGSLTEAAAAKVIVEEGTTGTMAYMAQVMLDAYGYLSFIPDADFGSQSVAATRQYQQDHNLDVDGWIGVLTWKSLFLVD